MIIRKHQCHYRSSQQQDQNQRCSMKKCSSCRPEACKFSHQLPQCLILNHLWLPGGYYLGFQRSFGHHRYQFSQLRHHLVLSLLFYVIFQQKAGDLKFWVFPYFSNTSKNCSSWTGMGKKSDTLIYSGSIPLYPILILVSILKYWQY